ncbi:hypothetical protein RM697_06135 [Ichthyenterobacterium sp. W332]|uniref:Phenylalanyl-tRNA synthetase subunit alpha n=1 Tax=Microcosmobacter mediterraneus TaxID=3075607 RepID=A0ABU2YJ70_9FLAO|nr:hypothetical protein [Ichthyenterobacterium sp. W332]MDT0558214.1 hypothetical protein [Ichthyenterobacterium sp. W332]
MKKDILIPEVNDVYIAAVNEFNDTYKTHDWNAYIINTKDVDLDIVLIIVRGYDQYKETSIMRHKLERLPAKSYAKIEFLQDDLLALNNEFKVSFFEGNSMFDKTYLFRENTINKKALQNIPLMGVKGVLVK